MWERTKSSFLNMKKLFALLIILIVAALAWEYGGKLLSQTTNTSIPNPFESKNEQTVKVLREENLVVDVVKNVGPSVITIGAERSRVNQNTNDPFSLFFGRGQEQENTNEEQYIGSGFVVKSDGLIVTNKHVVSDPDISYIVIDDDGKKYPITNIYRDPLNDIAILKTSSTPTGGFKTVELGNSDNLQVGQFVIAIGTALGEFRNTVTTGVISGLGRGITAGSPFEGFAERLDNVIQTDAAINPGNSGGPLLNSAGQVIGVNSAVASQGQNIGFSIPINSIKDSLNNFNATGQFNRPYLGVAYNIISERTAMVNEVPRGAYVQQVIQNSSADAAGVQEGDIITKIDGKNITDQEGGLAAVIAKKKIGDTITLTVYRNGNTQDIRVTLQATPEQ